jgi:hypothetical protein
MLSRVPHLDPPPLPGATLTRQGPIP